MKRRNKELCKIICGLLTASLVLSTAGCGTTSSQPNTTESTIAPEISSPADAYAGTREPQSAPLPEKELIADYFEYVCGEDYQNIKLTLSNDFYLPSYDIKDLVFERMKETLDTLDPAQFSPEDGLYKTLTFYHQLKDHDACNQAGLSSLRTYLNRIGKVKNLKQLYELYKDPTYALLNPLMNYSINQYSHGATTALYPQANISGLSPFNYSHFKSSIEELLIAAGYSQSEAQEIAKNSCDIDLELEKYRQQTSGLTLMYAVVDKTLADAGVQVPIMDILEAIGAVTSDHHFYYAFTAYSDFLNTIYTEENVPKIRDHMLVHALMILGLYSTDQVKAPLDRLIWGRELEEDENLDYNLILRLDQDQLTNYYAHTYIGPEALEQTRALTDDLIVATRQLISDTQWLSVHGKELAKRKVNHLKILIGTNALYATLEDVTLGDDPVENALAFMRSKDAFNKALFFTTADEGVANYNMLDVNAYYNYDINAIVIPSGWLSSPSAGSDAPYEERLAYLGQTIAHEISHAYDPNGSQYDEDGDYNPWMKEDEQSAYDLKTEAIAAFFDGKETDHGNPIKGKTVKEESFADLMSVECCLLILEKRENPDYDLFFRTYAKTHLEKASSTYEKLYLAGENHLPGRIRVNYILGQFDKFYEIYNIDPNSPYYIPRDQRLSAF